MRRPDSDRIALDAEAAHRFGLAHSDDRWFEHLRAADRCEAEAIGVLGRFALLRELSRGGQGIVYLARDPVTGERVVLKRPLAGAGATPAARARFAREVEIAADLDHPGLVGVRGIEHVDGEPVLVMEYVDGIAIDAWALGRDVAAGEPPSVREVSDALVEMCVAVQHAHGRGVLHRDIKAANVLVDADGRPRVVDFGLAKVLDADEGDSPTRSRDFLGTPRFASPEQLEGRASRIDVRSDVYSLGVVAHLALGGDLPFDRELGPVGLLEAMRSGRPQPVSRHARDIGRRLTRDFDLVVAKALAFEPDERYPTAAAFAEDLARAARGRPVEAHPPSARYVLAKLVRGHPVQSAAFAALALALLAATGLALWQADRAESERRDAERQRTAAELEAHRADAIRDYLVEGMIDLAHPQRAGADLTVREVLDASSKAVEARFPDDVGLRGSVRYAMADAYLSLGRLTAAEGLAREAVADLEAALEALEPLDSERAAGLGGELARANQALGRVLSVRGDLDAAEAPLLAAAEQFEAASPPAPHELARTWNELGALYLRSLRPERALEHLERTLRFLADEGLDDAEERHDAMMYLAPTLMTLGRGEEALETIRAARAIVEGLGDRIMTAENLLASCLSQEANVLASLGRAEEALPLLERARSIHARTFGEGHLETLGLAPLRLRMLVGVGRLQEADTESRRALELARESLAPDSPFLGQLLCERATVTMNLRDFEQSRELFREALGDLMRSREREHPQTVYARLGLARSLVRTGRLDEATPLVEELALDEPLLDRENRGFFCIVLAEVAGAHRQAGNAALAGEAFERARGAYAALEPRAFGEEASFLRAVARFERERGREEAAERLEAEAAELEEQASASR